MDFGNHANFYPCRHSRRDRRPVIAGRQAVQPDTEISKPVITIYALKAKYGGMDVNEAQEIPHSYGMRMRDLRSWWRLSAWIKMPCSR
jgi:hypothetical protein